MLLYVTLGTNDLQRSIRFYDPVMNALGFARHVTVEDEIGYGPVPALPQARKCLLWITRPYLKLPATWGNGTLVALPALSHDAVQAFHSAGLAHGGFDEGGPGFRPYHEKFYSCYLRDPDGNKLSAVCEI
jgi:catechol 2,3-dioxygenase-like lactoylglutathione lyase family enzyme